MESSCSDELKRIVERNRVLSKIIEELEVRLFYIENKKDSDDNVSYS